MVLCVTDASVHDLQVFSQLMDVDGTESSACADWEWNENGLDVSVTSMKKANGCTTLNRRATWKESYQI